MTEGGISISIGLDWQCKTHPPLDLEAATAKLCENEISQDVPPTTSGNVQVTKFHCLKFNSSEPCQDSVTHEVHDIKGVHWQFWGVNDGHAGWACSEVLRRSLISYVVRELQAVTTNDGEQIDAAIKKAFLLLDYEIVSNGLDAIQSGKKQAEVLSNMAPAVSGSCALLGIYNSSTSLLRVACTGDSRAVLARSLESGAFEAVELSVDQTLENPLEVERLQAAHPDEPLAINLTTKKILGSLVPTRSFGDHRAKWPLEAITEGRKHYYANPPRPHYITPPYVTAEPVVTTTTIHPNDILILATDGIWDSMPSAVSAQLLTQWVHESKTNPTLGTLKHHETTPSIITPGIGKPNAQIADAWGWESRPEDFVIEDRNAATCLIKNALGGKRREQFCGVVSTRHEEARDARDDMSAQVIFFGSV